MIFDDRSDRIVRDGPQLLWLQVADDIAADIKSGAMPPGARLAPELDLAERYKVARVTIRRAVEHLRKQGLIDVVHGRGTFVL